MPTYYPNPRESREYFAKATSPSRLGPKYMIETDCSKGNPSNKTYAETKDFS